MRLRCSAGHEKDTANRRPFNDDWLKKPGDLCGEEIDFDRLRGGTIRCRRILRLVEDEPNDNEKGTP